MSKRNLGESVWNIVSNITLADFVMAFVCVVGGTFLFFAVGSTFTRMFITTSQVKIVRLPEPVEEPIPAKGSGSGWERTVPATAAVNGREVSLIPPSGERDPKNLRKILDVDQDGPEKLYVYSTLYNERWVEIELHNGYESPITVDASGAKMHTANKKELPKTCTVKPDEYITVRFQLTDKISVSMDGKRIAKYEPFLWERPYLCSGTPWELFTDYKYADETKPPKGEALFPAVVVWMAFGDELPNYQIISYDMSGAVVKVTNNQKLPLMIAYPDPGKEDAVPLPPGETKFFKMKSYDRICFEPVDGNPEWDDITVLVRPQKVAEVMADPLYKGPRIK